MYMDRRRRVGIIMMIRGSSTFIQRLMKMRGVEVVAMDYIYIFIFLNSFYGWYGRDSFLG